MIPGITHSRKNILFLLFFLIADEFPLFCQTETLKELDGFRNSAWGCTADEIKAVETELYMQSFTGFGIYALSYTGSIAGLRARIDYTFKNEKLVEGSYTVEPEGNFENDFNKLSDVLISEYGKPSFKAGPSVDSVPVWIKANEYGSFKGPELYWQFSNGFIALVASKFEEKITLTVLFSNNKSIEDYNKDREISVEKFF